MIFGESGSGRKVGTLLAMPAAKGLFHRAVIQSGSSMRLVSAEAGDRLARLKWVLSREICRRYIWIAFARSGDPDTGKLPDWPIYSSRFIPKRRGTSWCWIMSARWLRSPFSRVARSCRKCCSCLRLSRADSVIHKLANYCVATKLGERNYLAEVVVASANRGATTFEY